MCGQVEEPAQDRPGCLAFVNVDYGEAGRLRRERSPVRRCVWDGEGDMWPGPWGSTQLAQFVAPGLFRQAVEGDNLVLLASVSPGLHRR